MCYRLVVLVTEDVVYARLGFITVTSLIPFVIDLEAPNHYQGSVICVRCLVGLTY